MLVFRLLKDYSNLRALAIVILAGKVNSKFCNGGHICSPPKECCPLGCCPVFASPGHRPSKSQISETSSSMSNILLWNHWFFWILLVLLLLVLLCGCGVWKKRQFFSNRFYHRTRRNEEERSEFDSTGSCYPPPQYSRCSSFHFAPPPYTEVTSKPDLYPLVISYKSENGKLGDNCVVMQYFRNYVVHPTLGSAGNNAMDSVNSSFFSQELDSNYPPSYEESRIEESNLTEPEPLDGMSYREQSTHYPSQRQNNRFSNAETPQIPLESIHPSVQKVLATVNESSELITNPPTPFKKGKTFKNSIRSPSDNFPFSDSVIGKAQRKNSKEADRSRRSLRITAFDQIQKSVLLSNSADSISFSFHPGHQYSSDVILAQPQRYCESNSDLHYDSSDILTNPSPFLLPVNDSCSSEDNLSQPRGSLQDFVSSDGLSHSQFSNPETNNFSTSSEVSSLHGCGSPDSPPRAISPTGEFRNLLEKIQQLPNRREGIKHFESSRSSREILNDQDQPLFSRESPEEEEKNSSSSSSFSSRVQEPEENEEMENRSLLDESTPFKSNPKKLKAIRPSEFPGKKTFPRKSKTFHIPFCHINNNNNNNSLSSKRNNNSKSNSNSAPVTPITNFPSPGSLSINFISNSNKLGCSKKNLESQTDGRLLLQDGEESCDDELF